MIIYYIKIVKSNFIIFGKIIKMNAPASIDYSNLHIFYYPTSESNNDSEVNIKKEFLLKTDNISYKLKIYSSNKYINFKIEKLDDLILYYYYNNYEHHKIVNILKLNEMLYDNFEKIIELINEAYLNEKISIMNNGNDNDSIDLRIDLPIGFKVYNCSLILKRKEFGINEKLELIMNEVHNVNINNEYKKIEKKILNIKQSTEKELNINSELNKSLNEKIKNNKNELEKNKIKIKLLKKEIDNLKNKIIEFINNTKQFKEKMNDLKDEKDDKNIKKIIEDKDKKKLTLEIDDKFYKDKIKDIILYYEQLISPSEIKKKVNELDYENFKKNIFNYDNKADKFNKNNEYIIIKNDEIEIKKTNIIQKEDNLNQMKENKDHLFNNFNTNQNEIINSKLKENGKDYNLSKLDFINNECKNCNRQSFKSIYKCVLCDDYFICNNCYKSKNKFHKHNDFFEIKYPDEIIRQIQKRINNNNTYNKIITKFNVILKDIFFDKDGNLSTKEIYDFNKYNLNQICKELNSINESPTNYFSVYKMTYLNQKQLEQFKKADQKLILNKMILLVNKLSEIEKDLKK